MEPQQQQRSSSNSSIRYTDSREVSSWLLERLALLDELGGG